MVRDAHATAEAVYRPDWGRIVATGATCSRGHRETRGSAALMAACSVFSAPPHAMTTLTEAS
jgi:hypothetical protein